MFAFRCKNCGKLHPPEHAGENLVPHSCVCCGKGVEFEHQRLTAKLRSLIADGKPKEAEAVIDELSKCDPATKRLIPDNWEVLHEADDERLAEIGLERSLVVKHAPVKITDPIRGKHVIAAASESLGAKQSEGGK